MGDGLAVLPFVGGSWVISSGNGEKVETVHVQNSVKEKMFTAHGDYKTFISCITRNQV